MESFSKRALRGSDIETKAHSITLRLRDSLEEAIKSGQKQAASSGERTSIYIPEDVYPVAGGFRYEALLVNAQLKTLKSKKGKCVSDAMKGCAAAIVATFGLRGV